MLALLVGSELGVIETKYQPMKIAAAEAQWTTCQPCSFSMFQIGGGNNDQTPTQIIEIPHLLSVLATGTWDGQVQGLNELNAQYQQQYGPGNYVPNVFIQYWSMRVMAYLAALVFLLSIWGRGCSDRKKLNDHDCSSSLATWAVITPFLMNTAGWMLTENGRQPWIVQGLMPTPGHGMSADGVSTSTGDRHQPGGLHPAVRGARPWSRPCSCSATPAGTARGRARTARGRGPSPASARWR